MRTTLTKRRLVLDLDECLIHSHCEEGVEKLNVMSPQHLSSRSRFFEITFDAPYDSIWGVKRPYLDEFLAFCDRYFEGVIVWSAGHREYVKRIVAELFRDHRMPDLVLTKDDCVGDGADYHKPLSVLKKKMPDLDMRLVLALDDRKINFIDNPDNGLTIPGFHPTVEKSFIHKDACLPQVINWLMQPEVMNAPDIRKVRKDKVFVTQKTTLHEHKEYTRYNPHCYFSPICESK